FAVKNRHPAWLTQPLKLGHNLVGVRHRLHVIVSGDRLRTPKNIRLNMPTVVIRGQRSLGCRRSRHRPVDNRPAPPGSAATVRLAPYPVGLSRPVGRRPPGPTPATAWAACSNEHHLAA